MNPPTRWAFPRERLAMLLLTLAALGLAPGEVARAAGGVGKVVFVKGVATAQRDGEPARFIGRAEPVFETDVLTTGKDSYAIFTLGVLIFGISIIMAGRFPSWAACSANRRL